MIEEADRDGDGEISEDEFMRIMRKTNLFWGLRLFSGKTDNVWTFFSESMSKRINKKDVCFKISISFFITWIKGQSRRTARQNTRPDLVSCLTAHHAYLYKHKI